MKELILSIHNATVRGLSGVVFTNLDFQLADGEHWAVTGGSGSGKTALLHTIAGRLSITGGSISYDFLKNFEPGPSTAPLKPHDLIALVDAKHHFKNLSNTGDLYYQQRFNSSDSEDALTVRQYLESVKGSHVIRQYWSMTNAPALLGLNGLLDKQIIKLSNGETKRLMITAALLKNPVLLLMDNPLAGLDIQTRGEFNHIVNQIIGSGIGIIMSCSTEELPSAITHIAVLHEKHIIQQTSKYRYKPADTANKGETPDQQILKELLNNDASAAGSYRHIVNMTDVTVKYGDKTILNKVNWQVLPGERWALSGPNGAGKSTLLSLINGDNPQAYANDIVLFDKKRGTGESIWDIKSKIGFVSPELYQYFPGDNSCLQAVESGFYDTMGLFRPSIESKAALSLKWMQALDIANYAGMLLKNIPASAQRLCLLARAMVKSPPLLIFDEPCQGLDAEQRQHFKNVLDTICSLSNVTLIYVTHYEQELAESVTKTLKLDKGLIVDCQ